LENQKISKNAGNLLGSHECPVLLALTKILFHTFLMEFNGNRHLRHESGIRRGIIDNPDIFDGVFVTGKPFQPSLIFIDAH
jgi:hypothetical protein